MPRAPFQVLVLPYTTGQLRYAVFRRADDPDVWQFIAGGGEGRETPAEAARREAAEEAGIPADARWLQLDSHATVPVVGLSGFLWGPEVLVVPEHCFAVEVGAHALRLSDEHTELRWCTYAEARALLRFDSNRNALWELDHRLRQSEALEKTEGPPPSGDEPS